jgi:hypothetical protein
MYYIRKIDIEGLEYIGGGDLAQAQQAFIPFLASATIFLSYITNSTQNRHQTTATFIMSDNRILKLLNNEVIPLLQPHSSLLQHDASSLQGKHST